MGLPTIDSETDIDTIRQEAIYTLGRLQAHAQTTPLAAPFAGVLDAWSAIAVQQRRHEDAVSMARAKIDAADAEIDPLVDAVSHAILLANNNDRSSPEYVQYFGTRRPFEIKRPVLGEELETVRSWIGPLKASSSPVLQELGGQCEAKVGLADSAVQEKAAAEQALRMFRLTGERRAFVDQVNALRKSTYGELAKLPHQPEGRHLPGDFADQFFLHDSRSGRGATVVGVRKQITATEARLAALKELLAELEAKEAEKAQARMGREALEAELAQAEALRAEADARAAELRARLKR